MKIRERIPKLIDMKTLVTFTLTAAFTYLAVYVEIERRYLCRSAQ